MRAWSLLAVVLLAGCAQPAAEPAEPGPIVPDIASLEPVEVHAVARGNQLTTCLPVITLSFFGLASVEPGPLDIPLETETVRLTATWTPTNPTTTELSVGIRGGADNGEEGATIMTAGVSPTVLEIPAQRLGNLARGHEVLVGAVPDCGPGGARVTYFDDQRVDFLVEFLTPSP